MMLDELSPARLGSIERCVCNELPLTREGSMAWPPCLIDLFQQRSVAPLIMFQLHPSAESSAVVERVKRR